MLLFKKHIAALNTVVTLSSYQSRKILLGKAKKVECSTSRIVVKFRFQTWILNPIIYLLKLLRLFSVLHVCYSLLKSLKYHYHA